MKEKLKIFESKKKIFSSVSYSRALIGQDSDSCETLRSRQIFAPSLHPTYFLILSAPTIYFFYIFAYIIFMAESTDEGHPKNGQFAPNWVKLP